METNPQAVIDKDYLTDAVLSYAINGCMAVTIADELLALPHTDRLHVSEQFEALTQQDTRLSNEHLLHMGRIISRETISDHTRDVFIGNACLEPVRGVKQGLGEVVYTHGRHSSPYTSGW